MWQSSERTPFIRLQGTRSGILFLFMVILTTVVFCGMPNKKAHRTHDTITIKKESSAAKRSLFLFFKKNTANKDSAIGAQKKRHSKPTGRHWFANATAQARVYIGNRMSSINPTAPFKRHGKKILILVCSIAIILATLSFYRQKYESKRFMTTTRLSIMDKEVQRACRYIEDHHIDPALSVDQICTALVTGKAFLEALFSKELGLSTTDFINQVRINRAKIALHQSPEKDPAEMAILVGYTGKDEFLSVFGRITGTDYATYTASLTNSTT